MRAVPVQARVLLCVCAHVIRLSVVDSAVIICTGYRLILCSKLKAHFEYYYTWCYVRCEKADPLFPSSSSVQYSTALTYSLLLLLPPHNGLTQPSPAGGGARRRAPRTIGLLRRTHGSCACFQHRWILGSWRLIAGRSGHVVKGADTNDAPPPPPPPQRERNEGGGSKRKRKPRKAMRPRKHAMES